MFAMNTNPHTKRMFTLLPQLIALMTAATPLASCQDAETELSNGSKIYTVSAQTQAEQRDPNATISASRKNAITTAVAKASPAVVGINVTEVRQERVSPFFGDPFFDQFFRDQGRIRQRKVKGLGSGFLISKDGYIITNDHVAGNATEIIVTTTDGKEYTAKLIASDRTNDVALLKIEGNNFSFLKLGNSDDLAIGEWAIAMGNPFGLFDKNQKPTVTVGVISNNGVTLGLQGDRNYRDMVQTDAAISSGNSGGPLLNANGEVIGVNATIYSTATSYGGEAGSIGLGFAIPVNKVKKIVDDFMSGKPARGAIADLGFVAVPLTDRIRQDHDIKAAEGVIVWQMYRNSIAERNGIEPGDVIKSVDNERIRSWEDFQSIIADHKPGDVVTLAIERGSREVLLKLKLEPQRVTGR
jgi:serine protease Do